MQARPKLVVLESPYAGAVEQNIQYARRCVRDSVLHNEAPLASHLLYTQTGILDDNDKEQRALGIAAGHAWIKRADYMVVYTDYGISAGMKDGIEEAERWATTIYYRKIGLNPILLIPAD
jgi:hypothetical protein